FGMSWARPNAPSRTRIAIATARRIRRPPPSSTSVGGTDQWCPLPVAEIGTLTETWNREPSRNRNVPLFRNDVTLYPPATYPGGRHGFTRHLQARRLHRHDRDGRRQGECALA